MRQGFKNEVETAHLFMSPGLLFRGVLIRMIDFCNFLERTLDLGHGRVPPHTKLVVEGFHSAHKWR